MANQNTTLAALTKIVNTDANGQPISVKPAFLPAASGLILDVNTPTFSSTGLLTASAGILGTTTFTVAGNQTSIFTLNRTIIFQNTRLNGQIYIVSSSVFTTVTTVTLSFGLLGADAFSIGTTIYTVAGGPQTQTAISEIEFLAHTVATTPVTSGVRATVSAPTILVDVNTPTYVSTGIVTTSAITAGTNTFTVAGNQTSIFYSYQRISFQNSTSNPVGSQFYLIISSVFTTFTTVTLNANVAATDVFPVGTTIYTAFGGPRIQNAVNEIEFSGFTPTFQTLPTGIKATLNSSRSQTITTTFLTAFTVPAGITRIKMIILGAGGGGGSSNIDGGAVGLAGTAGGSSSVTLNDAASLTTYYAAAGGTGGSGGIATGGTNGIIGGIAFRPVGGATTNYASMGGFGMAIPDRNAGVGSLGTSTLLGAGGFRGIAGALTGGVGFGYGSSGGGGGTTTTTATSYGGYGGGAGGCYNTYITVVPGQLLLCSAGVGGAGGASVGANSGAGGAGAPGVVILEW